MVKGDEKHMHGKNEEDMSKRDARQRTRRFRIWCEAHDAKARRWQVDGGRKRRICKVRMRRRGRAFKKDGRGLNITSLSEGNLQEAPDRLGECVH